MGTSLILPCSIYVLNLLLLVFEVSHKCSCFRRFCPNVTAATQPDLSCKCLSCHSHSSQVFPACTSGWDMLTDSWSMKANYWDELFISNGVFWLWLGSCCKISVDGASVGSLRTQLHLNLTDFLWVNKIFSVLVSFWRELSEVSRGLSFFLSGNGSRIQFQSENLCWRKIPSCFGSISTRAGQESWEGSLAGRCPCIELTHKKRSVSINLFWGLSVTCPLLSSSSTPSATKTLSLLLTVIQMPGHVERVVILRGNVSPGMAGVLSNAEKGISLSKG